MKTTLKPRAATARPSAEDALAIARTIAPSQPPAQVTDIDRPATLNIRLRASTVAAVTARAKERGFTLKQVVSHALADAGVAVAEADMEDRTPRRRR